MDPDTNQFSLITVSKKSDISEKILEIARNELREDDTRKDQALAQFRDWIEKHPAIKHCRTGL